MSVPLPPSSSSSAARGSPRLFRVSVPLRWKVAALPALAALLIGFLGALVAGRILERQVEQQAAQRADLVATDMAFRLSSTMAARVTEIKLLARNTAFTRALGNPNTIRSAIEDLQKQVPQHSWIGVTDASGRVVAATGRILEGVDISKRPVYLEGRKALNGTPWVGDVHAAKLLASYLPRPSSGGELEFVDISLALQDASGRVIGVLAAHLSWEWAEKTRTEVLERDASFQDIQIYIARGTGDVLLNVNAIGAARMTAVPVGRVGTVAWADGRNAITGHANSIGLGDFPGLGWHVVTRTSTNVVTRAVDALRVRMFAGSLALACLAALIGWIAAGRITSPVVAAVRSSRAALKRHGAAPARSGDEVRDLANYISHLDHDLEHAQAERVRFERQALHDPLTGLPNRAALTDEAHHAADRMRMGGSEFALLYIDLDGFKPINDTHGHEAGDFVLQSVAHRLDSELRTGDHAYRLGGDEFLVMIENAPQASAGIAGALARRLENTLKAPIVLPSGTPVRLGASIGIAIWGTPDVPWNDVLEQADAAMYAVKSSRRASGRAVAASGGE